MTTLDIQYNKDFELTRVRNSVSNFEWYIENGYKISLPDKITEESSEEEICIQIENQFTEEIYEKFSSELQTEWKRFSVQFEKVKDKSCITFNDTYAVFLTRYGTGGSFNPSLSQVTLKIEDRTMKSALGTLVHEMVHIAIHDYIQKYEVTHWRKERLVDLLVEHYFPGLRPIQTISEDVSAVDIAFKGYFPDIETTIKTIGRATTT